MFISPSSDLIRFVTWLNHLSVCMGVRVLTLHISNTHDGSVASIQDLAKQVDTNLIKFLSAWKIKFRFYIFRRRRKKEIDLPLPGPCFADLQHHPVCPIEGHVLTCSVMMSRWSLWKGLIEPWVGFLPFTFKGSSMGSRVVNSCATWREAGGRGWRCVNTTFDCHLDWMWVFFDN